VRDNGGFTLTKDSVPFSHFKLHPDLLKGLKDLGFVKPTPIQADAIPPALEGRKYYRPKERGFEKEIKRRLDGWEEIKKRRKVE